MVTTDDAEISSQRRHFVADDEPERGGLHSVGYALDGRQGCAGA
jgi:hypothetical protein